ncbi:MAG: hypothetical protein B7X90_13195 [Novosphingobium sp. 17-62-19]|uniref:hypothetical protein n=1 Tax=Novosphingobium sp. 17-62-19 TaxID=1970406 RepID=UPI000BD108C4|nr:hypothetical protein [Novosphingobium sp. 17-62-19]OYX94452.1 MAG: hypothetical protein B7Y74_06990 [Novosphingobium sp. 35-62-5]OZA17996.1 MAG: hypothetical protein B7X90_13195 [Novosphingobium sp. 17-62-19]HQS98035.1 hypothetical protein [Novosphingobium sp.]
MTDPEDTAPETVNNEQEDGEAQAQSVAEEALARATSVLGEQDLGERVPGQGDEPGSTPDVVDHMKQMVSSGIIDMGAFRGERSDDDEEGMLGEAGVDDDTPRPR